MDYERMLGDQLKGVLGEDEYYRLMGLLDEVPNGMCGVERFAFTFPKILRSRGINPITKYEDHQGTPIQDGRQAATPEQRELIQRALIENGFL